VPADTGPDALQGNPTVWIKSARGWNGIRADQVQTICAIQDPDQYETGPGRNPQRPVDIAVSAGVVDEDGEQLLRLGTCQAAYADESLHQLLTALTEAAVAQDARFVVVAGESPGPMPATTGGKITPLGPIRWKLHRDRWPVPPSPAAAAGSTYPGRT
jgi:hypothetical protein